MHRDIILLHMCTINENHMIMVPLILSTTDRTFCHFGPFFAFLPPSNPKSQNLKKEKNAWRYHNFTQNNQKSCSYATLLLRYDA